MHELTIENIAKHIADKTNHEIVDEEAFNESVYEALVNLLAPHMYMVEKEKRGIIREKGKVQNEQPQRTDKVADGSKGADERKGTRGKK